MSEFNALISKGNLELAWKRIVTARNLQHKKFFRHLYAGYELGLTENIELLHEKLVGSWRPTPPTRIYLPKSSGQLRPITLLAIEDQIVLQAVSNRLALQVRTRRSKVELKSVFSNCLDRKQDSIFFLQDWRRTYRAFQTRLECHLNGGYRWIAHFDLAAFYETISHRALRSVISPGGGNQEAWTRIMEWLCVWSAAKSGIRVDHGIPQGPIASDFLADIFMLPVDEAMKGRKFKYIRYVDDIRVLARTENDARIAAIALELACRKWSLIPQSSKFTVRQAQSLEDALGTLPSIAESANPGDEVSELDVKDAQILLRRAIKGRPPRVVNKSWLRYVLYRTAPNNKLLNLFLNAIRHISATSRLHNILILKKCNLKVAHHRSQCRIGGILDATEGPYV